MKCLFLCLLVLVSGSFCKTNDQCVVQDDRFSGTLIGKCQTKKSCLKSQRAAVLHKNAVGDKACPDDDDSVQCCLEISCGESNRCRNNVEENSCTEGTYQPNFRNHLFCPFTSSEKLACCVLKSALSARHMTIDSFEDGGETVAQLPPEQADYLPNVVPNYNLDDDSSNLDGPSVDELNKQNIAAHPELIDPTKPLTLENMKVTSEVSTVDAVKGLKAYKADSLYAPAAKQVWMWDSNTGSSLPEDGTHVLYNSQWKRPEIVNKWNLP